MFNIYLSIIILLVFVVISISILYLNIKSQNEALKTQFLQLSDEKNELHLKYEILNTRYVAEMKYSQEKIEVLQLAKDELSIEFQNLANKIFEDKSKQLNTANKEQLELLLKPFREQISNFSKEAREQFESELKDRYLLKDELKRLKQMNEQLSQDAINLTKALKGENKTQGNWGEMVLESILEDSGLRRGLEYELQATLRSDENKIYRPDVIIHMPQNRDIVIDSKVSLVAYERYVNADDQEMKKVALKEHIASITSHIKELSNKNYERLEGINTLDFVLLFIPIEGAFLLALEYDKEFFKYAYEKNILLVSPSTLVVTLRTIEHIWIIQRQEEHTKRIVKEAEGMYEKLVSFVDEMQNVGNHIQKSQDSFDKAMNRLSSGRGNIIKRAKNIKELGLKPKKEIQISSEDDE
jgi:DNA recombination protein RmuC